MDIGSWRKWDRVGFIVGMTILAVGVSALACELAYVMWIWKP